MQIEFLVQGSAAEPYVVTFHKEGDNLTANCDCEAGLHGIYCKHRIDILRGETKNIVSDNLEDVATIQLWLQGTPLESALREYRETEKLESEAKQRFSKAKKALARTMTEAL